MVSYKYILLIVLALSPLAYATSPFIMNLTTNTVYQNTNSTPLSIYAITHSSTLAGYLGTAQIKMQEVIQETGGSVTISSIVYSLAGYNMSTYMLVEPQEYYKFNFTDATFIGQYKPQVTTSSQAQTILLPELGQNEYSAGALILFSLGLLMFIFLILYTFTDIFKKAPNLKINMLFIFIIAMTTLALLIFSSFYQTQLSVPQYHIVSGNNTTTITTQTLLSTPLATNPLFGPIITLLSLTTSLLGLVLPAYYFIENSRRKKYRVK